VSKIIPVRQRKRVRRSDSKIISIGAGAAGAPQKKTSIDLVRLHFLLEEATESRESMDQFIAREPESAVQAPAIIVGMRLKLEKMDDDDPDRLILMRVIASWEKIAEHSRKHRAAQEMAEELGIDLDAQT